MCEENKSKKSPEPPIPLRECRIELFPDGKIDDFCFEMIEMLFGISKMLLTDESTLDDFDSFEEMSEYKYIKFADVPEADREHYSYLCETWAPEDLERLSVRYPPISEKKRIELMNAQRKRLIKLIEDTFRISMEEYPEGPLYVWQVARFIKTKLGFLEEQFYSQ